MTQQPSPLALALAAEIRARMADKSLSQDALGKLIRWDQRRVSRRVTGEVPLDAAEIEAIAGALGIPAAELIEAAEAKAVA